MSNRIDQRIVEMSFENHKFEKGIQQSKNSLKEFANALKNMGNGKEFSGLESSVDSISSSFSMMEQIGIGALRRIGDAAVNAGASLVKSLTVDQLSEGLSKYQQKIEAVQTMVSAGYGIDEVEAAMEQLMWFSDETSYSFSDMADNMAKFISAGVDLKTSGRAMQGIATWAAHSGKNSQAASIAMFNLSQAISMGYVDTLNWRSIMNQNMNTVMFKEIAIGVAEATGAIEKGQVTIQNFDTNLKDKWFTVDVLTRTLDQYSAYAEKVKEVQDEMGFDTATQAMDYMQTHSDKYKDVLDQIGNAAFKASQESKSFMDSINATMDAVSTGWLKTYEIIFGTLYEAKENFSALTEVLWTVFAASAEGRNEMLQLVKDGGGIKNLFQILKNTSVALLTPLRAISKAFDQFFPPRTETQWLSLISVMETITRRLIITDETAAKIQRTFAGFFAVLDIGWEVVKFLGSSLYEIVGAFIPLNDNLLDMTASVGDFLVVLNHLIKQSGVFQYGLLGVKIAAVTVRNILQSIIGNIFEFVHVLWTTDRPLKFISESMNKVFSGILDTLKTVISWISGRFTGALSSLHRFITTKLNIDSEGLFGGLLTTLKEFIEFIINEATGGILDFGSALDKLDFSRIATFVTGGVLLLFINQLSNLTRSMSNVLTSTNSFITKFSKKLFGTQTKIKDLAFTFGVLSASLFVLSKIPWDEMKRGLIGLSGAIGLFVAAYASIQAITVASSKALNGIEVVKSTLGLTSLAVGLAGMAITLRQISKINGEDVWRSVGVLGAMMGLVVAYQALSAFVSRIPGQKVMVASFKGMAAGLVALVGVILVLQFIKPETISGGLNKISSILGMLIVLQTLFAAASKLAGGNKLSTSMLGVSAGILGLIATIKILSALKISDLTQGIKNVFYIGGVLSAIQLMFSIAARVGGGVKFKATIFSMQMGLLSMVTILTIMDKIGQKKLQNGIGTLVKMAGIIAGLEVLTALAARIGGGNKLQRILGSVTLTMLSFTALIGIINFMKPETINKGLLTITKMLGLIIGFQALVALSSRLSAGATGGFGIIIGMVAGILTLTTSLLLLGMQDQTALTNSAKSMAITVASVGVMTTGIGIMMKNFTGLSIGLGGLKAIATNLIPGFAAMGVVLLSTLALVEIVKSSNVDNISWDGFGKFVVGLGAITALVTAFTVLTKIPGLVGGAAGLVSLIPGFAGMSAVVLATAGLFIVMASVMDSVDKVNWSNFGKFIAGTALIGIMALGVTLLSVPLALMGPAILPILGGVLAAVSGVGIVVLAFALLADIMELFYGNNPDTLIKGFDLLVLVGEGVGRFLGSIVGGFNSQLMIGYGEGLAGFAAAMASIDSGAFDGVESLAKALLILTGTSIIDGLSKWVNFGKNPGEVFGEQLGGLIRSLKGITAEDAKQTSDILIALKPMTENLKPVIDAATNIPNSGGLAEGFAGGNDVDDFAKQLVKFIKSLNKIDPSQASHVAGVFIALQPMLEGFKDFIIATSSIPNSDGILGNIFGNNDIDDFGKKITKFVKSLNKIDTAQASHTAGVFIALQPMLDGFKNFISATGDIPNTGGSVVSWWVGNNDIDTFGKQISKFVKSLSGLDNGKVTNASSNLKVMASDMLPGLRRFITLSNELQEGAGGWAQALPMLNLATTLKEFVRILQDVDVSIVAPALRSLAGINESFKDIGSEVISNATKSFENNKQPFQLAIIKLLNETTTAVESRKEPIATSFSNVIKYALEKSREYIGDFKTLGFDIARGLQSGIKSGQSIVTEATTTMTKNVIRASQQGFQINSPSKVFEDIGGWLGVGLGNGIKRNSTVAILASTSMADGVENAIRNTLEVHSESPKFNGIGEWVTRSFGNGIQNGKEAVLSIAENLGLDTGDTTIKGITKGLVGAEGAVTTGINNLLELLTGEKTITTIAEDLGIQTGGNFSDGFSQGLDGTSGIAKAKGISSTIAKDAFQIFKESVDKRKEYNVMSYDEEIALWEAFASQYAEGTETRMKADKQIGRLKYENSKQWIDKEKYYKRLSLEEELAAWERVQGRYEKGHAYRMEAEREIFRLKQEIWQAEYQHQLDIIDEEKYFGRMNLTQELKAWKNIINMTEEGSDEYKKSLREIFRLENDIADANEEYAEKLKQIDIDRTEKRKKLDEDYYNKSKEINDKLIRDIKTETDAYENALKSRTQALYSAWGLFDKVDPFKPIDGNELFNNLESQVVAFDQWQAQIGVLTAKGVDKGLVEELREMGPKSLPQILALNKMTDTQLNGYVSLWQKKTREAKDQAVYELTDLKNQTDVKIAELNRDAERELDKYEKIWEESLEEVNTESRKQLDELETNWVGTVGSMTEDSMELIKGFRKDWFGEIAETIKDTKGQMAELEQITKDLAPMTNAVTAAVTTSLNSINTEPSGKAITTGLAKGISSNTKVVTKATTNLGKSTVKDLNQTLMIHSPSRKTMEIGKYFVEGLARGIQQFSGSVYTQSANVGKMALEAMSLSMDSIPDLLDSDSDTFTIAPVLDLTNVRSGMYDINSMLGTASGLDLGATMNLLPTMGAPNQNGILAGIKEALIDASKQEVDLSGTLTVQVVNDKGEIVDIAETAIKDILRRESR